MGLPIVFNIDEIVEGTEGGRVVSIGVLWNWSPAEINEY